MCVTVCVTYGKRCVAVRRIRTRIYRTRNKWSKFGTNQASFTTQAQETIKYIRWYVYSHDCFGVRLKYLSGWVYLCTSTQHSDSTIPSTFVLQQLWKYTSLRWGYTLRRRLLQLQLLRHARAWQFRLVTCAFGTFVHLHTLVCKCNTSLSLFMKLYVSQCDLVYV